jgi:hypothetical protein
VTNKQLMRLGPRLAAIAAFPSLLSVPGIAFWSLFG